MTQKRVFTFDGNLSESLFDDIAAADVVVVSDGDAHAQYVRGVAHGMGKAVAEQGSDVDAARPVWAAFPLSDLLDPAAISDPVRRSLQQQRVFTAADLERLDLDALVKAPGMTRFTLTAFVKALSRSERYPKPDALRDFIIRRGIFV